MAISTPCPLCKQIITGTLEDLQRHYAVCAAKKQRSGAGEKPKGRTQRKPDPREGERPALHYIRFFIPVMLTSSNNAMLHAHVGAAFADKDRWRKAVDPLLLGFQPAKNRRKLDIVRSAMTVLDKDNLYGSAKFLIDAIKTAGALVDDNPEWVDLDVDQKWMPEEGKGMLVTITDLGAPQNADEAARPGQDGEAPCSEVQAPPPA